MSPPDAPKEDGGADAEGQQSPTPSAFTFSPAEAFVRLLAGGELFGLPLLDVREVVPAGILSAIPRAPACALGVMNIHGRIIPVIDLVALVNGVPTAPRAFCLVLDDGQRRLGLGVDGVHGVGSLDVQDGIGRHEDRAVSVLTRADLFERVDGAFAAVMPAATGGR